jgi:uncharacterized protein YeaO (DUF488 family)
VYARAAPDDGVRVLTTTYWPRGISRETVDEYVRVLGPTRELLQSYKGGTIKWQIYEREYLKLMSGKEQRQQIVRLADLAREQTVTVMCMCPDAKHCHRTLLKGLIVIEMFSSGHGRE